MFHLTTRNKNDGLTRRERFPLTPFEQLFERFFQGLPSLGPASDKSWKWDFDVTEEDDRILVKAEAPGFEPGDFDLEVQGGRLLLRAARKAEKKEEGTFEKTEQQFFQSISLPGEVKADKAEARYKNGILTVTLPRTEQGKAKKIAIKA